MHERLYNRRIKILQRKIRSVYSKYVLSHFKYSRESDEILHNILKDNPVDDSKCEYTWNIMGQEVIVGTTKK